MDGSGDFSNNTRSKRVASDSSNARHANDLRRFARPVRPLHRVRLQPLRLLLSAISGWVDREQAATINYLLEEHLVGRRQLNADTCPRRISSGMRLFPRARRSNATE